MTKAELVIKLAEKHNLSKAEAERVLKDVFRLISEALDKGERVHIPGFGTFTVKERAERKGRNPRTGEPMVIPARKVVAFKPSKALKTEVND